jgi:hypothetical protein
MAIKERKLAKKADTLKWVEKTIAEAKGAQEEIARNDAMPVRFSKDDGVRFDPRWQDDVIRAKKS